MRRSTKTKAFIMIILPVLAVIAMAAAGAGAVSGYNYYMRVEFENTGSGTETMAFRMPINAEGLVDNYYIQPDAEDVVIEVYSGTEPITAMDLTNSSANWRVEHTTIPPDTTVSKTMYFGNGTATRDQTWIADDQDSNYVINSGTSPFDCGTKSFSMECTITIPGTPASEQIIIEKGQNYKLAISGTPCYEFTVWTSGGTEHSINIPAAINTTVDLLAWYDGSHMVITDYAQQSSGTLVATLMVSGTPVHIAECDAIIDDLKIYTE